MSGLYSDIFQLAERAQEEGDIETANILRTLYGSHFGMSTSKLAQICAEFCMNEIERMYLQKWMDAIEEKGL